MSRYATQLYDHDCICLHLKLTEDAPPPCTRITTYNRLNTATGTGPMSRRQETESKVTLYLHLYPLFVS